jgi:predicted nucleic acid-binding protein
VNEIVAEEAARLRAIYNLKMPDAIVISKAIIYEADVLLTNDHRLASVKEIQVIKLAEL